MKKEIKNFTFLAAAFLASHANVYAEYEETPQITSTFEHQAGEDCCVQDSSCGHGFISADFLYLRASQTGLDYCFNTDYTTQIINGTPVYTFDTDIKDPNFKWRPGYRVAAGWQFADKEWGIAGVYTHFNSKATTSIGAQNLHWKIDFDVVDALAGTPLYKGCHATLVAIGGIRFAHIDQKTHAFRVSDFLGITKADRNKQNFCGLGPLVGLGLTYSVGCGLSVFADAAVGALYGHHHVRLENTVTSPTDIRILKSRQKSSAFVGVLDADLGLQWDTQVFSREIFVRLGAELHRYFSYNRLGEHDDLCIDGGKLSAGFEF